MILIHRVDTLIKLILRTITRNLSVSHAGLLLYDNAKDEYVVRISRGTGGQKIPSGLVKVTKNSSLIRYFTDSRFKEFGTEYLTLDKVRSLLRFKKVRNDSELTEFFEDIKFQFSLHNARAYIPGFFRDKLVCVMFLGKKLNRKRISKSEMGFLSVLSSDAVMAIQNAWFFQDLSHQLKLNKQLFLQTVMALAAAIDAKDKYTSGHTERVSKYSLAIAKELKEMGRISSSNWDQFFERLRIASLLHDIGKIGVRETVLNKKGLLDPKERKEIEKHPSVGYSILNQVDGFQELIQGVKYHHERYDGTGYPDGLKGGQIPMVAQIISVADAFDAMTTDRPYRKKLSDAAAIKELKKNKGKQFPPLVVDAFLRCYAKGQLDSKYLKELTAKSNDDIL